MNTAQNTTPEQAETIIYNFLRSAYGLPDQISKIITAQSGHETNGWTSNVYQTLNNAFGFGYTGGGNYYGYNSIEDSVTDVVNWLSAKVPDFQNITDRDAYAEAIRAKGYFTDNVTNYENGLQRWFNNNLTLGAGIGIGAILILGVIVFLVTKK
jgi:hypothetical protein